MRFDGWTAVVTGAGSGIGAATAEAFLAEGVVIAGDLDPDTVPEGCRAHREWGACWPE